MYNKYLFPTLDTTQKPTQQNISGGGLSGSRFVFPRQSRRHPLIIKMPKQYKIVLDDEQEKYVSENCISVQKLLKKALKDQMDKDKKGFVNIFRD